MFVFPLLAFVFPAPLLVPSQWPHPCHPSCVQVLCWLEGTLAGLAPLSRHSLVSRRCAPRARDGGWRTLLGRRSAHGNFFRLLWADYDYGYDAIRRFGDLPLYPVNPR